MVEVMRKMATSFKGALHARLSQCPRPCSRPPLTHASTGDSWTTLGQSLVGSLLLSPGSWCTQGSVCALQESVSPVLYKFWQLCGGLMVTSSKRAYAIPRSSAPKAPAPAAAVHCELIAPQETPKHSSVSVSAGSLGPGAHKLCLSSPSVSGKYGVWF